MTKKSIKAADKQTIKSPDSNNPHIIHNMWLPVIKQSDYNVQFSGHLQVNRVMLFTVSFLPQIDPRWHWFFMGWMSFLLHTIKSLKKTVSADPNQWHSPILSSSTTRFLLLFSLFQLSQCLSKVMN